MKRKFPPSPVYGNSMIFLNQIISIGGIHEKEVPSKQNTTQQSTTGTRMSNINKLRKHYNCIQGSDIILCSHYLY